MPTAKPSAQHTPIRGRPSSSSSGAPATWPSAWCCPRSTASPPKGCCPGSGCWSGTGAGTSRTRTSASTFTTCSPSSARSRSRPVEVVRRAGPVRRRGVQSDDPGSLLDVLGEARESLGGDAQLVHYLAVPPVAFAELTKGFGQHGLAQGARVVYEKPFGTSQQSFRELDQVVHSVLNESRSTGSTISWARRPPRTCMCCVSPTNYSPRCGTAGTSRRCRSMSPRSSASPTGQGSTTPPGRCWTCWSRTCSRWPLRWPWNRPPAWGRPTCRPPGKR